MIDETPEPTPEEAAVPAEVEDSTAVHDAAPAVPDPAVAAPESMPVSGEAVAPEAGAPLPPEPPPHEAPPPLGVAGPGGTESRFAPPPPPSFDDPVRQPPSSTTAEHPELLVAGAFAGGLIFALLLKHLAR